MYKIMIIKSKRGVNSLYQFLTENVVDDETGEETAVPVEINTDEELDAFVEQMLNDGGYAKADFIIVKCVEYTIDAKDYSDSPDAVDNDEPQDEPPVDNDNP